MEEDRYNNKYNDIPVHYCEHCGSLEIITDSGGDYCGDCGRIKIKTTTIELWEQHYKERYGNYYIYK